MQVNSVDNYSIKNKYYKLNNTSVSFEGFGIRKFISKKHSSTERVQKIIDDTCHRYGNSRD